MRTDGHAFIEFADLMTESINAYRHAAGTGRDFRDVNRRSGVGRRLAVVVQPGEGEVLVVRMHQQLEDILGEADVGGRDAVDNAAADQVAPPRDRAP